MKNKGKYPTVQDYDDERNFESPVKKVIEQKSLKSVFQPIVHHEHNSVYAYEALGRPQINDTFINPLEWFRNAGKCGLSIEADLLSLTTAFQNFSEVTSSSRLFVNVMPRNLEQSGFVHTLASILQNMSFSTQSLVIELTEFLAYSFPEIKKSISTLRSLGIRIAVDDVGIENASLRAIVELEPDFIKIDRALIHGIAVSEPKQRMLSALKYYMDSGETMIAEGVEVVEDLQVLKESGVRLSQGFYWGKPLPAAESLKATINFDRK